MGCCQSVPQAVIEQAANLSAAVCFKVWTQYERPFQASRLGGAAVSLDLRSFHSALNPAMLSCPQLTLLRPVFHDRHMSDQEREERRKAVQQCELIVG